MLDHHDCLNTQRCDNTIGSYTCFRTTSCGTGYTLNSEKGVCEGMLERVSLYTMNLKINQNQKKMLKIFKNDNSVIQLTLRIKTMTSASRGCTIATTWVRSISVATRKDRSGASAKDATTAPTDLHCWTRLRDNASARRSARRDSSRLLEADAMVQ